MLAGLLETYMKYKKIFRCSSYFSNYGFLCENVSNISNSLITIEIKPKLETETLKICRFCSQHYPCLYCPRNIKHNNSTVTSLNLNKLLLDPRNNLKIFLSGNMIDPLEIIKNRIHYDFFHNIITNFNYMYCVAKIEKHYEIYQISHDLSVLHCILDDINPLCISFLLDLDLKLQRKSL